MAIGDDPQNLWPRLWVEAVEDIGIAESVVQIHILQDCPINPQEERQGAINKRGEARQERQSITGKAQQDRQSATREAKRNRRGMAWREGCGATRERQHDERGGGAPSHVVGEAAVHRFIMQQPTLFGSIPGRVGGDFYNDDDSNEDNNDKDDHNKDDDNIYDN